MSFISTPVQSIAAPGTAGNVLTSDGSAWISAAAPSPSNVQTFTSSGTWTKPTGATGVLVLVWGAGGGGSQGAYSSGGGGQGGGGGAFAQKFFRESDLTATVAITIGAGGIGGGNPGSVSPPEAFPPGSGPFWGTNGGSSSFGSYLVAQGGGGGGGFDSGTTMQANIGGNLFGTVARYYYGASTYGALFISAISNTWSFLNPGTITGNGGAAIDGGDSLGYGPGFYGGGAGGSVFTTAASPNGAGYGSYFGGGGGGAGASSTDAAGTGGFAGGIPFTFKGGNNTQATGGFLQGGRGGVRASSGQQGGPAGGGGGGGGGSSANRGGTGGNGLVIVYTWK